MALEGGGTQESILPARGGGGRVSGGGQDGAGGGRQPGDRRWRLNNVGLLEEQVWTGSRWMATGQVRNPVEGADGGAAGRIQFESERVLAEARAKEALAQAESALASAERTGDLTELDREKMALDLLIAENDLRALQQRTLYGEIGATKRTLIQEKGLARQAALKAQREDPFMQAAILGGGVMRGTSPAQAFGQELSSFIDQPLPEYSMDMSPKELQGILSVMGGIEAPQAPAFGMARGGIIEMERDGENGPFTMRPRKVSRLIGEGLHREGLAAGTAEVLTVEKGPFGIKSVEVTPLAGGLAQGGWMEGIGGMTAAKQALSPLFTGMGLPMIPRTEIGGGGIRFPFLGGGGQPGGGPFGPYRSRTDFLSAMGVTPQLVRIGKEGSRFGPKGQVFYNEDGTLRPFTSMGQFRGKGFSMSDVVNLGDLALSQLGTRGKAVGKMPITAPESLSAFGAAGTPIIEPSSGIMLPAPHKLAGIWNQITPAQKINIYSAYSSAGVYPEILDSILGAATPQAGAFGGRRIGFTGGFM